MIINADREAAQIVKDNLSCPSTNILCVSSMRKARTIPILILSSQSCHVEQQEVLQAGAHAYIGHPYSLEKCLAQTQALMQLNGENLQFTRKEFGLLLCLASNPGQAFSREQLYNQVWDEHAAYNVDDVVKSQIRLLRQKLSVTGKEYIKNVWGVGYRFHSEPGNEQPLVARLLVKENRQPG